MTPILRTTEPLEAAYQRWWAHPAQPVPRDPWAWLTPPPPPAPHCGRWYSLDAPIPPTARWAVVYVARPGRVRYAKSRTAAASMLAEIALQDHPHAILAPISRTAPETSLAEVLQRHGIQKETP